MQETQEKWVRSLGKEDPLEEEMATHYSILAWRIPWREEPGRLQSMGSQRATVNSAIIHLLSKSEGSFFYYAFLILMQCSVCPLTADKESSCQSRSPSRCRFNACVGKIPWSRKQQPTLVFLPEKSHGQRSLVGSRGAIPTSRT